MTETAPLISVCIANYNGIAFIDDCLQSVLSQEGHLSVEILIHDDASNDGSVAHIRSRYPEVNLIESKENVGFCVANNRMAAKAQGKYLLLLNNDAALYSDALRTLFADAERPERQVIPAITSLPQYDATTGELIDRGCLLDPFLNPVPNRDPRRHNVGMVIGACLWIPKRLWEQLGGFPEWFGSIGEDLYLCCRARLVGSPVQVLGTSGYRHRVGQSFGGGKLQHGRLSTTFLRRALSERNKTFVLTTTCPTPFMQLLLPMHLLLLLIEGILLTILQRRLAYLGRIYLPVFPALLRWRKELRAERKTAMTSRRIARADFFVGTDPLPYKLRMLLRHGLPRLT